MSTGKYKISGSPDKDTPFEGVTPVRIQTWAVGGRGIGRVEGRVWMVAGAVPGDEVEAQVVHDRGRFIEAVSRRLIRPSPSRRATPWERPGPISTRIFGD